VIFWTDVDADKCHVNWREKKLNAVLGVRRQIPENLIVISSEKCCLFWFTEELKIM
jgi:hypothetical protein